MVIIIQFDSNHIFDRIRSSCRKVADRARRIKIDRSRIPAYAASLPLGQVTNRLIPNMIEVVSDGAYVSTNGSAVFPYDTWARATAVPKDALDAVTTAMQLGASAGSVSISNGFLKTGG